MIEALAATEIRSETPAPGATPSAEAMFGMLALAREKTAEGDRKLVEELGGVMCGPLGVVERDLAARILCELLGDVEMAVRRRLAERIAAAGAGTADLCAWLGNDEIEVARPILMRSKIIRDDQLVTIVRERTREHRIAIAMREQVGPELSAALAERGEPEVLVALVANAQAELGREALTRAVMASRTERRLQAPLLSRTDLPADLAHRMFWWVSGGLRLAILRDHRIDERTLDALLEQAISVATTEAVASSCAAEKVIAKLAERGELTYERLRGLVKEGKVSAAIHGFARLSGYAVRTVRQVLMDDGGEAVAVMMKALGHPREMFHTTYIMCRQANGHGKVVPPATFAGLMQLFDRIDRDKAAAVMKVWDRICSAADTDEPAPAGSERIASAAPAR